MGAIKDQVIYGLESPKDFYKRLISEKKFHPNNPVIEEQMKFNRKLIQKKVKIDCLEARITKRIRNVAKQYDGINHYYDNELVLVKYILQIIKQAIEEAENE